MIRRLFLFVLAAVLLSGCSRGPDQSQVQAAVENRLQAVFAKPVLDVESLRRLGSGPLADAPDGAARRIVYFNGRFRLARDYAFSDWQSLNPAALATLLGATERGVEGIARDGNHAGDILQIRGSVTFREGPGGWQAVDFVPPPQATASQAATGSPARATIERIQNLFNNLPANSQRARAIITEELAAADRQIARRLDRLRSAFVVAGGPEAGEYDLVARTIAARLTAQGFSASSSSTQGSIENLQLLQRGAANIALAQGDIARQAYLGQGAFGGTAHNPGLRAIASLYPEAFHIAVLADGPVQSIADLRGRRLDAGLAASGTRASTLKIMAAHGLATGSVELVSSASFDEAVQALVDKRVDAIASVIHAPARQLQRLAADHRVRILPLSPPAITQLTREDPAFVRLVLAPGTYPGQGAPIATVGVTALLVTGNETPADEVRGVLQAVFEQADFVAAGSPAGGQITRATAREGVTIPLHEASERYFQEATAPR
ncbi:TAXI family TRAP transporter solute-binding subunit [Pigmentiphaga sp.]|uniref:TAXI family TRAP transporter solute-binding subunit n=1 Tax=Pigmentiphaga sp. TaxID=1977564 RepID=UPI0025D94979|nr:TAXI family TRAP transporter solute-binding subunit [Pigmentiphaga sp.]